MIRIDISNQAAISLEQSAAWYEMKLAGLRQD